MAQHDYVIANQSGAAFRADLNNALAAISSQNSGAAEPSVTYAYMPWADTTTGLFKIRNSSNSGWVTLYQLDGEWSTLKVENGTAAAPSIYFKDSGTDTGLYSPGADQVGIATGGVQRVKWSATEAVFNDDGADVDFRVEGDTNPNLFKIDAGTDQVQVANLNGGPLAGFRNLLINGNPTINQREYVSGTAGGANSYSLDRWRIVTSGQSVSWTDSNNVRTVTAPAGGVEQEIEGESIYSGSYTLSWVGTATATVNGSAVANGETVTLTGGANAIVRFSGGTFSLAQLERGTVATPFEHRPHTVEIALCERYLQIVSANTRDYAGAAGRISCSSINFRVKMRDTPTIGVVAGSRGNVSSVDIGDIRAIGCRHSITSAGLGDAYALNETLNANAEIF